MFLDLLLEPFKYLFGILFKFIGISILVIAIPGIIYYAITSFIDWLRRDKIKFDVDQYSVKSSYDELHKLLASIGNEMYALGKLLMSIDSSLAHASIELDRGAASLFWEKIEKASKDLREVASKQRRIAWFNKEFLDKADVLYKEYQLGHPGVPYSSEIRDSIETEKSLCNKLSDLAYRAHAIDSFAHIFEIRRTNSILLAGFHTLTEAIDSMNESISNSLDDFMSSFDKLHKTYLRNEDTEKRERYKVDEHLQRLNASANASRDKLGEALYEIKRITQR